VTAHLKFPQFGSFRARPHWNVRNAGIGSVKGPGFWQFDLSVTRTFQIREMQKVEFRAEAFNLANRFIMQDPTVDLNSNKFGQVTCSKGSSHHAIRTEVSLSNP